MADPAGRIPVTVITGFLGSGKTTLLNRLIADPLLKDTAVVVNEFGETGLDHLLVEQANDGVIELSDGCLCCTVRGDLIDTLASLIDRVQTGRIAKLSRIVIETTGLADPAPVMAAVLGHPVLMQMIALEGVVAVADAVNGANTLDNHVEAVKQIAVADAILLSKTDLTGKAQAETLRKRLRSINPVAPVGETGTFGPADFTALGLFDPRNLGEDARRWVAAELDGTKHNEHAREGHDHRHHHDVSRHDSRIRSFSLVHDQPVEKLAIGLFLDLMRSAHGDKLLRMKGLVETKEHPDKPLVLHAAQRVLHPPVTLDKWPDGVRGTRLVVIVFDLEEAFVRRLFDAFAGRIAPDAPDAKALTENPLAIPGMG